MYQQTTLNKQKLLQKTDQNFSNDIFARLLSTAENYANRFRNNNNYNYSYSNNFDYYDTLNSGKNKKKEELKKQLIFEIEVFKNSFQNYKKKYNCDYDFPVNLNKSETIDYLLKWKNLVNLEDQKYFESIIELITDGNTKTFKNEIIENEKNNKNTIDPNLLMHYFPKFKYYGEKMRNNVIQQFEKNGDFSSKLVLGKKFEDDKNFQNFDIYSVFKNYDIKGKLYINTFYYVFFEAFIEYGKIIGEFTENEDEKFNFNCNNSFKIVYYTNKDDKLKEKNGKIKKDNQIIIENLFYEKKNYTLTIYIDNINHSFEGKFTLSESYL